MRSTEAPFPILDLAPHLLHPWMEALGKASDMRIRVAGLRSGVLLSAIWCTAAWGQSYPGRLVTIGSCSRPARRIGGPRHGEQLQSQIGQSVIAENRPAANGTIATGPSPSAARRLRFHHPLPSP
jgi:hypothetical protein